MTSAPRFAVIGGGIIGAAVAREVLLRIPDAVVTLFEKEDGPARHQTGHNSGVVHAGLYYQPGGLKARLCRRGVALLSEYSVDRNIPFDRCGKVVVALDDSERVRLEGIHERAVRNGVPGARLVGPEELREIEPETVGVGALHSSSTAIIDYRQVVEHLVDDVRSAGGTVRFGLEIREVRDVHGDGSRGPVVMHDARGDTHEADIAIACAGLQSDRLARSSGAERDPAIVPFFGQYLVLEPRFRQITNGLVYPAPDPRYPFLGVHLTKRVDGEMTIGPNAFLSLSREGYSGHRIDLRDAIAVAGDPGFWRFASRNVPGALRELGGVLSTRRLVERAARYVPAVAGAAVVPAPRGIRAQALARDGKLVDDFVIEHAGRVTHIRNAPSPGATSSLAIAEHIVADVIAEHSISALGA